jgi:hypothetical protein
LAGAGIDCRALACRLRRPTQELGTIAATHSFHQFLHMLTTLPREEALPLEEAFESFLQI